MALAVGQHLAQAFHGFVVGGVQVRAALGQQFHGLADATRLVDAALLADGQVHGQVQEGVGAVRLQVVVALHGGVHVVQFREVLGVLRDPQAGQGLDRLHRGVILHFAAHAAEKAAHIGLRGVEKHDGRQRSMGRRDLSPGAIRSCVSA